MKAYIVPWRLGNRLAIGGEGYRLKGPILFVLEQGAIFYESSLAGDGDGCGFVTVATDRFERDQEFLRGLWRQIKGEKLEEPYNTKRFDLSQGVLEVDIPEAEFRSVAAEAEIAYPALRRFRDYAFTLISGIESRIGHRPLHPE